MKKIIIGLIILVIVGGGYYVWKSSSSESEFLTYEFEGITFRFPASWELEEDFYSSPGQVASGELPTQVGYCIKPINQKDEQDDICIGGRQMSCQDYYGFTRCASSEPIYTKSTNSEVLEVYDSLVNLDERIKNIKKYDEEELRRLQEEADDGHQPWILNALSVAEIMGKGYYGFDYRDNFYFEGHSPEGDQAYIGITHNSHSGIDNYTITMKQAFQREGSIWVVESIKKLKD